MPIYVYACTNCGERTEARQGFDDPPLEECPNCGGKLRKMYSPVGIVFKGSGFYSTDAKRGTAGKAKSDPKDGSSGDKAKTDSGSASKSSWSSTGSSTKKEGSG